LAQNWRSNQISAVIISHVVTGARFALEWTPSRLDTDAFCRLTVRQPDRHGLTKQLFAEVEKITGKVSTNEPVVRWGFVFLDDNGGRAFSIYLDTSGRRAVVNDAPMDLDTDALFQWAESTFKHIFHFEP
jgi:hypothetical protein